MVFFLTQIFEYLKSCTAGHLVAGRKTDSRCECNVSFQKLSYNMLKNLQAAGNCRWKGQVSPCAAMECTFQGIGKNCLFILQSIVTEASKFKFALQNFY